MTFDPKRPFALESDESAGSTKIGIDLSYLMVEALDSVYRDYPDAKGQFRVELLSDGAENVLQSLGYTSATEGYLDLISRVRQEGPAFCEREWPV